MKKLQYVITGSAIVLIVVHILYPELKVDEITVMLFAIAVIPWLTGLFKSMKLPNGVEFEFQELKDINNEAKAIGLISSTPEKNAKEYDFMQIAESNTSLALAGLRIELERSLKKLSEVKGINQKRAGIFHLMTNLYNNEIITLEEMSVLSDMINVLNKATHGDDFDPRIAEWIINTGPQILASINQKIEKLD